jgi:hypothetical protein
VLNCLLRKLDDPLRRSDTDVLALAVQVLDQGFGRVGDGRFETVQGSLDNGVPLVFKLLTEDLASPLKIDWFY